MDKGIINSIKIGVIGDYDSERVSHLATNEALRHCGEALNINVEIKWISTESLEKNAGEQLSEFNGLWCAPGSPYNSLKGALNGIKFARENNYPFIGTCGGFQHAVIEYIVNKLKLRDLKNDEEKSLFITPLSCSLLGETSKILISKDSKLYTYYNKEEIEERYNCNFGVNPEYEKLLHEDGFKIVGIDLEGEARILQLLDMRFYVATLFQPQLSSTPENPHKLIIEYLKATINYKSIKENIKLMTINNYDDIYEIWERLPGVGTSSADSRDSIKNYLDRNPNLSYIYCTNDKIIGTILCGHDGRRGFIHHACVIPEYQGQGIGKLLVENSLQALKEQGIDKCHIFVFIDNEKGQEFWNKLDWIKRDDIVVYSKSY